MSNTTKPKFFYCYLDNETILNHLSDEQSGKLWKMLFEYANYDIKADISDPILAMAFDVMTQQIDRDFKKYKDKCEKNKQNRAKANDRQRSSTTVNVRDQEEEKEEYKEEEKDKEENKEKNKKEKEEKNEEEYKEEIEEDYIFVEQDSTVCNSQIIDIINYLNLKLDTNYKASTKTTRRCIIARLKEGFTVDDFKKVIDQKANEWQYTDMSKYLRPETLFGPKFESYLNSPCQQKIDVSNPFVGYEVLN